MKSDTAERQAIMEELKSFLRSHLAADISALWGQLPETWIRFAESYSWDITQQRFRIDDLIRYGAEAPECRILDVGAGCGQFVDYALTEGYDCWGIEPEGWKLEFIRRKARFLGREALEGRIRKGVGEAIPFPDNEFGMCSTYQTLEHVQNPKKVLEEMIRVTRVGGGICLRCPDYRSAFEAHYQLPWLPLFPKGLAKLYLRSLGRPLTGLDTIRYTTKPRIIRWLRQLERDKGWRLSVVDDSERRFANRLGLLKIPCPPGMYRLWFLTKWIRQLGRQEVDVNLFVRISGK